MPRVTQENVKTKDGAPSKADVAKLIGEMEFDEGLKLGMYGQSGTGKTTTWATWPGPILALICSGAGRSGELRSLNTPELRKKIKQAPITNTNQIAPLMEVAEEKGFKTVVLDHSAGLQDLVIMEHLGLDDMPTQKSWGMLTQQDWGVVGLRTKEHLRTILRYPKHVVIVSQERIFNNEDERMSEIILPQVGAALSPATKGWLDTAVDYIAQTFKREKMVTKQTKIGGKTQETVVASGKVEYCLRVGPHLVFTTKFRQPKGRELPDCIVDPTYDKFVKILGD